jgi:FkbM family methyltransferase
MGLDSLIGDAGHARLVQSRHGYLLHNVHDIYIGRSIATYGEYSEGEVGLFAQICGPGDLVVEAGSNIGAHTVPLAQMVSPGGYVYAFEPQRSVYQILCANVALNSLSNVRAYQLALASEAGSAYIPNVSYEADGNFGGISLSKMPNENTVAVHQLILDDLLDLPRLRLLKVDVEGMEVDVLRGAEQTIQRLRPVIYVENDRPEASESLIRLISDMGYVLHWHVVPLFNTRNFAGISENVFPGIDSINMLATPAEMNARIVGLIPVADATDHPLREQTQLRNLRSSVVHFSENARGGG